MWKCPKCKAMNYEKGACECCGYTGVESTEAPHKITFPEIPSPSRTDEPFYTPRIWC